MHHGCWCVGTTAPPAPPVPMVMLSSIKRDQYEININVKMN